MNWKLVVLEGALLTSIVVLSSVCDLKEDRVWAIVIVIAVFILLCPYLFYYASIKSKEVERRTIEFNYDQKIKYETDVMKLNEKCRADNRIMELSKQIEDLKTELIGEQLKSKSLEEGQVKNIKEFYLFILSKVSTGADNGCISSQLKEIKNGYEEFQKTIKL